MATNIRDLCRLCAKKEEFLRDLFDESNKNVLTLIQEFIKIVVNDCEGLPTKICLNCEEKVVSFQLFILECRKAQDYLKSIFVENNGSYSKIKVEDNADVVEVKSEVKNEFTPEDIVSAINNEASFSDLDAVEYNEEDGDENDNDCDYDDSDSNDKDYKHKIIKNKRPKRKRMTPEDSHKLDEILQKSYLKAKDLVKMICEICGEELKNWNVLTVHCIKNHKIKPLVYCICGFPITSHSVLYKHISDHKAESRKYRPTVENEKVKQEKYDSLHVKDFVKFICTSCKKQCSSWYSLKSHSEKAHKVLPVVTCKCGVTLKSKSVLYKHVQDHKNPNVFICDKCPRIMKSLIALNKHKVRHIPKAERKFNCFSCDKIFNTKDSLKSHEKSHIPIEERKIYHCEICNLKFTTRSSAASHKRVVHDRIKSYVCDLCGYACGTNGELRQHRAIHSDEKPFVCNKCSKPFKTYSNLKTHMDTHEDTSYVCFVCSRVLNSRRTLRKHLLVHEDKCRHVCSYCNKAFKRRQTLKVHMYTHTGDKPLTCKWCDARFSYASTLRSHRLRCHPDKMAQANNAYAPYVHAQSDEYLKTDVADVAKNEVEAI